MFISRGTYTRIIGILLSLFFCMQTMSYSETKLTNIGNLQGHSSKVTSLSISPDNKLLATASTWSMNEPFVLLWDIKTGRKLDKLTIPTGGITDLEFSPDGAYLAASTNNNSGVSQIFVWETATKNLIHTLKGHTDSISSLVFTPDGKTLISGGVDKKIYFWDIYSGAELVSPIIVSNSVKCLSYNAQKDYFAVGQDNNTIQIITKQGERIKTLTNVFKESRSVIEDVEFSPDGKLLVSTASFFENRYEKPVIFNADQDYQQRPLLKNEFLSAGGSWDKFTFSSDGKFIIQISSGGDTLDVFLSATGALITSMQDTNFTSFYNPTISKDMKTIVMGDWSEVGLVDSSELLNYKILTKIEIVEKNAENKLILKQNEQTKISIQGFYDNNTQEILKNVTWKSSNPFVAIVNEGNIVAREMGRTVLTATYGSFTATIEVEVTPPDKKIIGLKVETKTHILQPKFETELSVKGIFDNGTEESIPAENLTITTSNGKIISVYKNFIVANDYGQAEALITYKGVEKSIEFDVQRVSSPKVDEITEKSKVIAGVTQPNLVVIAKVSNNVIGAASADQNGAYAITITPLKAASVVEVFAKDEKNNLSLGSKIIVKDVTPPKPPVISKITSENTVFKGKAEANSTVFVKIGTVIYQVKANSKGEFSLKIKKLKKGMVIQVYAVDIAGNKGESIVVKVQ